MTVRHNPLMWFHRSWLLLNGVLALLAFTAALLLMPASLAAAGRTLYSIAASDTKLRTIDPDTGETLSAIEITYSGHSFTNGAALASDPTSGRLLALLKLDDHFRNFILVEIDPATGKATRIDNFDDPVSPIRQHAALAFDDEGTLYTMSSSVGGNDGSPTANSLFIFDEKTKKLRFFAKLASSFNGVGMGYNPFDGKIYHLTGPLDGQARTNEPGPKDPPPRTGKELLEHIDLVTKEITVVDLSGDEIDRAMALTMTDQGSFLGVHRFDPHPDDQESILLRITEDGAITTLATLDHLSKGLAFLPPVTASATAGDFDGDGMSDIFWRHGEDGRNRLWFMDGMDRDAQGTPPSFANTAWQVAGLGDFDGDALIDVLWHNVNNGKNRIWLMDGEVRRFRAPSNSSSACSGRWRGWPTITGTASAISSGDIRAMAATSCG